MAALKIALAVSDFEDGGVERNLTSLAHGLAKLGAETWLLAGDAGHPYLEGLDPAVRVVAIPGGDDRTAFLRAFLQQARPDVLVTGKLRDDLAALEARAGLPTAAGGATKLVAAVGTPLSGRFAAHWWNPIKTRREVRRIRDAYRQLDGITAVSQEIADDLRQVFRVTGVPVAVLNNPIIPEGLAALAAAHCPHPWLAPGQLGPDGRAPVLVALGGLRKVKDFPTLLRAFARLGRPQLRLLVIGEGKERVRLQRLAHRLGIAERLDLHGFVANPFPYLGRASALALSSRREGLPNALVEALALGTPVVATDCTSGVRTLLQDGRLGRLVPVGDLAAMAKALAQTLDDRDAGTLDRDALKDAAQPFRLLSAAQGYLEFFGQLSTVNCQLSTGKA